MRRNWWIKNVRRRRCRRCRRGGRGIGKGMFIKDDMSGDNNETRV
jgi:hypothetical protein